jgi:hypothetical protein
MIPFVGNLRKQKLTYSEREQISGCQELGVGEGKEYKCVQGNFWRRWNYWIA